MILRLRNFVQRCRSGTEIVVSTTLLVLFFPFAGLAQVKDQLVKYNDWDRYVLISQFYQMNNFRFAWIGNEKAQTQLRYILSSADSLGLNATDYQNKFLSATDSQTVLLNLNDSVDADVHFTDAAIHFFTELKFGNRVPPFGYTGLRYNPSANNTISSLLFTYLKGSLKDLVSLVQPQTIEYSNVVSSLNWFRRIVAEDDFKDARIVSKKVDVTNKPLLFRLYQLGMTDSVLKTGNKKIIIEKLKKAQSFFDLLNDGTLRTTALEAFNVPLKRRIEELKTALNYLRWTDEIKQASSVLLLNIPSAYLMVYDKGKIILDSKVIVGKPATPTPILTSTITQVILYPFWNVPNKIATKELLPAIKRNIGYLEAGNYQVLNNEGRVLDPYKIDWKSLSAAYFPYHI
ncbi:MAG TPA: L,D-transpeptidase family protein, partial [Flavisolibacter sp.]|nr:L,D-transpeptidase family protein [Flavisolibacter sp.]